uniref:BSD domain-containing protein n=1 Tax=Cannabis sativa TaxID=3483 RepID=A0A803QB78_CANSA
MSWLIKTLRSDDPQDATSSPSEENPLTGELSVIGHTIGRQLRGVAAFLAPPPASQPTTGAQSLPESENESLDLVGIRNDLAEIGGSFKSGLNLLSSNSNRAEQKPIANDSMQRRKKGKKVMHNRRKFGMSDAQREHASTIEQYIPEFAALRLRLCRSMSQEIFWMVYFILLVPRLSGHDFELLSTPKIVEARDVLLQKLQKNREAQSETSENSEVPNASQGPIQVSKKEGKENPSSNVNEKFEVLPKEQPEDKEIVHSSGSAADSTSLKFETEDDISFSDLEDDDSEVSRKLSEDKRGQDGRSSSANESNDWVQLSKSPEARKNSTQSREKDSEGEESSDWLNVDDFD